MKAAEATSHTIEIQTYVLDVVTPHMHRDSTAVLRSTNTKIAVELDATKMLFT